MRRSLAFTAVLSAVAVLLAGCATKRTDEAVRSLTNAFFEALQAGNGSRAESFVTGPGGTMRPLIRSAELQKDLIPSYSIERIHEVNKDTVQVFVVIPGTDTTTMIALVARRRGSTWRFDPEVQVETRVNTLSNGGAADAPAAPAQRSSPQ